MRRTALTLALVMGLSGLVGAGVARAEPASAPDAVDLAWTTLPGAGGVADVATTRAEPPAPPWGACGRSTDPQKLVRLFVKNRTVDFVLRCGGPLHSSNPAWGYRHILKRHKTDFERLAAGTYQNWRDVADKGMAANTSDPDRTTNAGGGKTCYSRVIYLVNRRTNQVVRTAIIRMIVGNDNNIITSYPGAHCR